MLSVFFFFFFVWFGVLCLFFPFFSSQGRCLKTFSGANFCFWVSWLVLCFSIAFCLGFCFVIWFFAPENVSEKFSSCQVCCFRGFVLFLLVFRRRRLFVFVFVVFSREKAQG